MSRPIFGKHGWLHNTACLTAQSGSLEESSVNNDPNYDVTKLKFCLKTHCKAKIAKASVIVSQK